MSETAIELVHPKEGLAITQEQLTLARNTVAKGLNDNEFALFQYNCARQGIHPLDGLLIPVIRMDNGERRLTFTSTIDLFRARAAESGEYAGSEDAIFQYDDPSNYPATATVSVWRLVQGQRCMFTATARWTEYYPGEKMGFMWRNKSHVMLSKCAEALALRKGFPKQLGGLYIPEEMERPDDTEAKPAKPAPAPVQKTTAKAPNSQPAPMQTAPQTPSAPAEAMQGKDESAITDRQFRMLMAIQKSAGIDDEKLKAELVKHNITSRKLIPKSLFQDVIDWCDPDFRFHARPNQDAEDDF